MAGSFAKISGHGAVLDTAKLDRITAEIRPNARKIVEKYGLMITASAVGFSPIDTGALMNSITSESKMTGDMTFTVSDGVEYGIHQEFGTSKMAAHPFMRPAIEKWGTKFMEAFRGLFFV